MFSRPKDPERFHAKVLEKGKKHYGVRNFKDNEGDTPLDWVLAISTVFIYGWMICWATAR